MKKIFFVLSAVCLIIASCQKADYFGNTPTGEALGPLSLLAPATNDTITLNIAIPDSTVQISWTAATPGVHTAPTYKWVAALKDGGDINAPIISIPSDNNGSATTLTLTQTQVDSVLNAHQVPVGGSVQLIWGVVADNGSTTVQSDKTNTLTIARFQTNGVTPFFLLGPVSSASTVTINPGSTSDSVRFNWTRSTGTPSATPVLYTIYFYKDDGSTTPLFSLPSNNSGADSVFSISYKDLSDALTSNGFSDLTQIANLRWTATASSGSVVQWNSYVNQFYLVRKVNLFLVGGATPISWTPTDALQFIQDNSTTGVYYIYTYLNPGNGGFKLLGLKADWGAAGQTIYGETNGADQSGNNAANNTGVLTTNNGGNNIAVPGAAGVYRIQVNLATMQYNVVQKGVGIVGAVNGWDANNPIYMSYMGVDKFMILQDFTSGNEQFKFHDGVNGWTSGYGSSNYFGVPSGDKYDPNNAKNKLIIPGDNVFQNDNPEPAPGRWRLIFDGSDPSNLKYQVTYANTMRIVGDAITPNWDPANSPQMTYMGNGVWKATNVQLEGGKQFKFVASASWPSGGPDDKYYLDYEDNGPGKIADNGGNNISFSGSTGLYTVTLDEYNQTYTIQ
ncbi:SusE domain-containing protein [Ferruginibacter albus]|uniref:SusE domain-containing protein n=1 Tax=Ferruginibacter albus TaxID=2875540 RepID=UPI001CC517CD|nr:SusE domain-containing protein [Ferruginibacter albus]UAY51605.1 SusE domain-containing protein [Ferruginibacter albus]